MFDLACACHEHGPALDHAEEEGGAHPAVAQRVGTVLLLDLGVAGQQFGVEIRLSA